MAEPVRSTIQLADAKGVVRHGGEWLVLWSDPDSVKTVADKAAERRQSARRGEYERFIAAALRGIAHRPSLRVLFRGQDPEVSGEEVVLPALPVDPGPHALAVARGIADGVAVRLRWHDPALHLALAPAEPRRRGVFDVLEQARCEALGMRELPGLQDNLTAALEERLAQLGLSRAHLAAAIPAPEAMRMIGRDVLTGAGRPSIASNGMEMWDRFVRRRLGDELDALRTTLHDQRRFAALALEAVGALAGAMAWEPDVRGRGPAATANVLAAGDPIDPESRRVGEARVLVDLARADLDAAALEAIERSGADVDVATAPRLPNGPDPAQPGRARYLAYLTAHDIVVDAADLCDAGEAARLRQQLDAALGDMRRLLIRLANRLQRQLMAQRLRAWDFDLDEGLLDAARLDRVVTTPGSALSFKQERPSDFMDTMVCLLIDNSGSMRGRPITIAAMAADLVVRALERCGVGAEVLGFTTRSWKGGRPQQAWAAAGCPPAPGRLNELCHIVYKAADVPWRRARQALGAMLKPELLKENVDGEALEWACTRLLARPEQRRILIVISDGAPADQATMLANADEDCLDRHLRAVIARIEAEQRIELLAIGIQHDVSRYYPQAVRVDDVANLGPALLGALERLFAPPGRQERHAQPAQPPPVRANPLVGSY